MKLRDIMENTNLDIIQGSIDLEINRIQYDSRKVNQGDVFFCIDGYNVDGHKYIQDAINNGAIAIVCQKDIDMDFKNCSVIKAKDSRKALAISAANYYKNPSRKMKIIGITGTNGKTTSAFMIKEILQQKGYKVGLIGTIANYIEKKKIHTERTTPESLELHELFSQMVECKVDYCVMEVSSHSLSLDRVYGIEFCESIFTNLTQDHLDFHKTFENYFNAKLMLFKNTKNSIINIDDVYGEKAYSLIKDNKLSFGLNNSDVMAIDIKVHSRGSKFTLKYESNSFEVELSIPGNYNVYNALGAIAVCLSQGVEPSLIKIALKKVQVPGRCELVKDTHNLGFEIILDYAHSPDGLENILKTAREFTKGKLICVFGCGGDRDKTKRPIMGRIGSQLCDALVITSDNPRNEDPLEIINDIVKGMEKHNFEIIESRKEAIKRAMEVASSGDVIVIAGKGHEDYQILKDKTIHFDEREVVSEIIKERF
ncbi:UDP-N-acetylmuramoyl-L-alanyl-D-glutamate--2,6-diaminopimelate ligase [Clostridium sp. CS001]|uniref:UDP-N-acetylmuramoyl-L-alanyl-D-glutamate--2, 6-diaminopimelate ligase n=1 Tax=Clostridium sp. CS001 TaxID=2880648 RepID=UPI001CF5070D|nr:UDP-N-acetylmuramoyl-L-alanyl-D-glutamate--2,6-diaminopimelate ligase [Clostridium sp. CS001]MCB2288905.1 UDP-N-acetylmuramoyl-L-alanyl-D-glutamate--2,6-diaminopimelate ligase [Clostridium sp. CS001]